MENAQTYSARRELLEALMTKVDNDLYPSSTMLDMIEQLLTTDDVPVYTEMLMSRIRSDRFPSISLMHRVQALA